MTIEVEKPVQSFRDILISNPHDSWWQSAQKWYMRSPLSTNNTLRLLETLQVDKFQQLPKWIARKMSSNMKFQSTYTLADSTLESLINYATSQILVNEKLHFGAIGTCTLLGIGNLYSGDLGFAIFEGGAILANAYCILA